MDRLKYLKNKKDNKNNFKLDKIYNYKINKYNFNKINNLELNNFINNFNINKNQQKNIEKINKNLKNLNNFEITDILKNTKLNENKLLYSILYCIDCNISYLDIIIFLNEFKNYIIYDVSNKEFENKNKIIKNLQNDDELNHLSLNFLSNYLNLNFVIIRFNNFYKIISDEKYNTIILIKNNNKYYSLFNKEYKSYFIKNINNIEKIFKNYKNYYFDVLKSITYYKIDELKEISLLFDIELNKKEGKKKLKKELYDEIILKI